MANARHAEVAERRRSRRRRGSSWVERLQLTNFRNYAGLTLRVGPQPVVLCGPNGAGKTNLLEALSLLASGQGLRRRALSGAGARSARRGWAVAAHLRTPHGAVDIGTGGSASAETAPPQPAASCASTARTSRAPARSPTTSRWSG